MVLNSFQSDDVQALHARLLQVEKERDLLKTFNMSSAQRLLSVASGKPVSFFWRDIQASIQTILPDCYGLLLVRSKGSQNWALASRDEKNAALLNSEGQLGALPRALMTFSESPSCPKRREVNIQLSVDWGLWKGFLELNDFSDVVMLNVSTKQYDDYLMVFFQCQSTDISDDVIDLVFDESVNCMKAVSQREYSDRCLFEDGHRDPKTALLRRYSFENNFAMVLKDSRRHFQRVALMSLRLHTRINQEDALDLKALADLIQSTVRDNDLVAYYDDGEFVMGIRIRHMEDAEVVANKLMKALRDPTLAAKKLISDGVSIGISFYPEHSSLDDLYRAASFAENSVSESFGHRLEFHGRVYSSSNDFYVF
ncbi:response regulator PleD [Marinomonas spartinae]|uniref:Response regulator PleD n=1 Tax=Marinomonas spartinae TaxID=1792290 RepID=A0A1A8T5Z4_9GAMM|nr:GGDEF domain-containing protein [Marinomonas spartinae]SBS26448.1 response regulator PleD [Marinomonas spartinae]SBS40157.1 response regulator PleD [Marinomonas spartinae]